MTYSIWHTIPTQPPLRRGGVNRVPPAHLDPPRLRYGETGSAKRAGRQGVKGGKGLIGANRYPLDATYQLWEQKTLDR